MSLVTDLILPLGIGFWVFWWWFQLSKNRKYYRNIPSPPTVPIFGHVLDMWDKKNLLPVMLGYVRDYGGVVKLKIGPVRTNILVADYKMLEFILSSTRPTMLTKPAVYQFLKPWLGSGLLIGSGPKWKKHRKILTPAFHFQILENFIDIFESCGETLIGKLSEEVGKNSFDVYPFVTLCTLDIICETTMGIKINAQDEVNSEYVHSVKEMCRITVERAVSIVQRYDFAFKFTSNYQVQKKAVRILHEKANSVIFQRSNELQKSSKNSSTGKKVFLDLLLEAKVDGQPLSHSDIREEVDTFMFAGHDTTSTAITFTLFCLATYPEVQRLVHEEQQLLFEGEKKPNMTYAHLQSMKYLEQVIKETLRLYPSVPLLGRQFDEEIQYENTLFPKNTQIILFPFGIHRDPNYFENPEIFDPSRFENTDGKLPYAYIPFSAGPRNCIGQKFAMLEMKSVISKVVRNFELQSAIPEHHLQLVSETVLISVNGVKIKLKNRS